MTTTYEQLEAAVLGLITGYKTDLTKHDREAIEANPGVPFLHWTNSTGTHLTFLPPADDECYPKNGVYVKYLFGAADRQHILDERVRMADWHNNKFNSPETRTVHHFDGTRLHKITTVKACEIARQYRSKVESDWRKPHKSYRDSFGTLVA